MAMYDSESLQIFIDDFEKYRSFEPPMPMRMLHGNLYFGGVPSRVNAEAAISKHFSGCISDATLNGIIINFGNLTETPDAIVGKCIEGARRQPLHRPPTLPPPKGGFPVTPSTARPPPIIPDVEKEVPSTAKPEPETPRPQITRPDHPPECKLPLYPTTSVQDVEFSAYRTEAIVGSRLEFVVPTKLKHKFDFSLDIRTEASDGLIFYVSDQRHVDFVAVYIRQGLVNYGFNCGSGAAHITSSVAVNDKNWHTIRFQRQGNVGTLYVDNVPTEGSSHGNAKTINTETTYYFGGLDPAPFISSPDSLAKVISNVKGINISLDGCIRDLKLNNQSLGKPSKRVKVNPCDLDGAFFSNDGGYVKLYEKFRIGRRFDVVMEIKPRALSGLLMAVHSKEAFFVLEMYNGELRMSIDVGHGEITASFRPPDAYLLCDGNWHTVTGLKAINILTVAVDGKFSDPSIGPHKRKDADTRHTLYLGGHPNLKHQRGVLSKTQYVGCIRNIQIKGIKEKIEPRNIFGNVTGGVCFD
uniref:Laminin A chain, putative n=1 Tax=Riptortus pedestris TaxID=329032 RepID=R4WDV9_RIPPE|nr:laminin A chain, putative [Riptortus pedestris]